ncbi:MAG: O-antigen ligase family protein [Cyanobacteria bacterium P01_C01_bin.72]
MIGTQQLSVPRPLVEKLEIAATVFWLLYFLDVNIPPPIPPAAINALSYPFVLLLVAMHWKQVAYVATRNIPLLLFLALAMFSTVWSADITSTLDISRGLLRTFMFGAYFTARYNLKEQMKILVWVIGLAAVLSLLVCLGVPSYGIVKDGWQGIFPYKNYMGRSMVLGGVLLVTLALNNWQNWFYWLGFGLTFFLAIVSQSSTSVLLLILLLAQMPLYGLVKQRYRLRVILLSLACVAISAVFVLVVAQQETILVDILGEGTSFNGRTPIWTLVIDVVSQNRPWFGYGYGGFWTSDAGAHVIANTWASDLGLRDNFNAHSVYIEMFAYLGIVGIILYAIVYINVTIKGMVLLLARKQLEYFWLYQFLMFVTLASLADVGLGVSATNAYGILSIAACLSISLEYQRLRKKQSLKNIA